MTQQSFNSAFQNLMVAQLPPPDPHQMAIEIVRRDRLRTRVLAGLSLLCWCIATAGMLLLIYGLDRLVIYVRIADSGLVQPGAPAHPTTGPISAQTMQMLWGTSLLHHSLPLVAVSIGALMLAALFTVMLVFSSRKATLNHINMTLTHMSQELMQMRQLQRAENAPAVPTK